MNIEDMRDYGNGEYALPNKDLKLAGDYLQGLYVKILSTIAQRAKCPSDAQIMFLRRIVWGFDKEGVLEEYTRRALYLSDDDIQDFVLNLHDSKLKYYFALDGMILATLSDTKNESIAYLCDLIRLLDISEHNLKYITLIAKAALLQKYDFIENASEFCSAQMRELDVLPYLSHLYTKSVVENKVERAVSFFENYDIKNLIPVLEELCTIGNAKAMHMLALIYETGAEGIKRNNMLANELYANSFQKGYSPARVRMLIPFKGTIDEKLCEKELSILLPSLKKLVDEGDGFAAEELARIYLNASFVDMDRNEGYKLAFRYFEKAPAPLGLYGLAIRYEKGNGVEKNLQTAFELYVASAALGYCDASYRVALAYQEGNGINKNPTRAFYYYKRAYEQGSHEAINQYGWCLSNNFGTENDYDLAYKIFMEGAELGLAVPTSNVAWCYQNGRGVEKDMSLARRYYEKAIELGSDWAKEQLAKYF